MTTANHYQALHQILYAFEQSEAEEHSFADALAACRDAGAASWSLFFLTKFGRLKRRGAGYLLLSSEPVTQDDWDAIGIEAYAKENPEKAIAAGVQRAAPAEVYESTELNENDRYQACTVARCTISGDVVTSWGTSPRSAARSLAELSNVCGCGAKWHEDEATAA